MVNDCAGRSTFVLDFNDRMGGCFGEDSFGERHTMVDQ